MTGPVLIALITAVSGLVGSLVVQWPAIIDARSRARTRRLVEKRAEQLWALGAHGKSLELVSWLHDPEHVLPKSIESSDQGGSDGSSPRRIGSR